MNLTPEQEAAVLADAPIVCVDAGAGSGKTRVLIARILHLLDARRVKLDRIVAITFTDKAAAEMKERLRREARRKAPKDDPQRMTFWRDIERRTDSARISTIHGFCTAILKENALRLGKDPDFSVLNEAESYLLRSEVVDAYLRERIEAEDAAVLRLAAEYRFGDLLAILTALLQRRAGLERFLADGLPCGGDAATLQSQWERMVAAERERRIAGLERDPRVVACAKRLGELAGCCRDPNDAREQMRQTLLACLDRILRQRDWQDAHAALQQAIELNAKGGSKKKWDPESAFDEVKGVRDQLKKAAEDASIEQLEPEFEARAAQLTVDLWKAFADVSEQLKKAKDANNAYDFDDLVLETARLFRREGARPDSACARTAREIDHILIDEFQDTDGTQWEIVRRLFESPDGPRLFIVGDAKQAIYYFRGADVEVFRGARAGAAQTIAMYRNFRSTPEVLNFINQYFAETGLLEAVEPHYSDLVPDRKPANEVRIEFLLPPFEDELKAEEYRRREAELIASRVAEMCRQDGGARIFDKELEVDRPARFGDVGILFRALSDVAFYEAALRKANVPYSLVAGAGYYERQEIVDLRNLLTVVVDPWNEMALLAVLRGPFVGLSDEALVRLVGGPGGPDGLAAAFHGNGSCGDDDQDGRLARARELLAELRAHQYLSVDRFVRYAVERTGFEAIQLTQFLGAQRAENVRKAMDLAGVFARTEGAGLRSYLQYLEEVAAEEIREGEAGMHSQGNAVTLTTVHKAKGLEFPIVVVADMARQIQGSRAALFAYDRDLGIALKVMGNNGDLQCPAMHRVIAERDGKNSRAEEARVLYVAMTRAREYLILCGSPKAREHDSWFGAFLPRFALADAQDGEIRAGNGWQAIIRRVPRPVPPAGPILAGETRAEIESVRRRIGPWRGPCQPRETFSVREIAQVLAPDLDLEAGADGRSGERHGPDPIARGRVIHRFLEHWNPQIDPETLIGQILFVECPRRADREALHSDLLRLTEILSNPPMKDWFAPAAAIARETPFVLGVSGALIRGQIDLVLADGSVVDYKTGLRTAQHLDAYEWQVRLYAAAATALGRPPVTRAILCYLDEMPGPLLHEVDVSPDRIDETLARTAAAIAELRRAAPAAS